MDYCYGCKENHDTNTSNYCIILYQGKNSKCPCAECIIKPMCSDYCDDWDKLFDICMGFNE